MVKSCVYHESFNHERCLLKLKRICRFANGSISLVTNIRIRLKVPSGFICLPFTYIIDFKFQLAIPRMDLPRKLMNLKYTRSIQRVK